MGGFVQSLVIGTLIFWAEEIAEAASIVLARWY
jgi:hypothetical protein